jgi:hypothetical protein
MDDQETLTQGQQTPPWLEIGLEDVRKHVQQGIWPATLPDDVNPELLEDWLPGKVLSQHSNPQTILLIPRERSSTSGRVQETLRVA